MPLNAERRKALSKLVPEGAIVTRQWLLENQFDRHAIDNLVKTDQLQVISHGIYGRGELPNSWEPIIYALQAYHRSDCVVGGLTALELQGLAHYLPLSKQLKRSKESASADATALPTAFKILSFCINGSVALHCVPDVPHLQA